ncbi:MAG: protein kinase [Polyangiaceae bacterium]|nr:protein kinase [Polyangiaceae bacterium]
MGEQIDHLSRAPAGRFTLVAQLAEGRRSSVWVAEDHLGARRVALKLFPEHDPSSFLRLEREARASGRVDHENTIPILEYGRADDHGPYLSMPLVEGKTLGAILDSVGRVPERWARSVLLQILSALQAVHEVGGAHGDVSPSNCVCEGFTTFDEPPKVRLADWGSARWPNDPEPEAADAGTALYAAPERAALTPPSVASDLYSVGVIAYEMACGVPPFRASTTAELAWQHANEPPRSPREIAPDARISQRLEAAIMRALKKAPAERFGSARELAASLADDGESRGSDPRQHAVTVQPDNEVRAALLARVREYWIEGVLDRAMDGVILVKQSIVVAEAVGDGEAASSGERVIGLSDAFERCGRALVLVGAPGHGKTVNLLRLARQMADRAARPDGSVEAIPVVFTLSAWRTSDTELLGWMCGELAAKYQIPRTAGSRLLSQGALVPLLDGLDDVPLPCRARCVDAIQTFHRAHPAVGIVVTCRTEDHAGLPARLALGGTVELRPLDERDIARQLKAQTQRPLLAALESDPILAELSRTPVLLHVMRIGFRDSTSFRGAVANRAEAVYSVFEAYVSAALGGSGRDNRVAGPEVRDALETVARHLTRTGRTVFLLEDTQPDGLTTRGQLLAYAFLSRAVVAALFCLSTVLAVGLSPLENEGFETTLGFAVALASVSFLVLTAGFGLLGYRALARPAHPPSGRIVDFARALALGGVLGGAAGAVIHPIYPHPIATVMSLEMGIVGSAILSLSRRKCSGSSKDVVPVEMLGWSWRNIEPRAVVGLALACCALFVFFSWIEVRSTAVYVATAVACVGLGILGHRTRSLAVRASPNVGIHRTLRNAAAAATMTFAASSLLFGITYGLYGAFVGLTVATVTGLFLGGVDAINHYAVRLVLHASGVVPFEIVSRLDKSVAFGLTRRVGNGYMYMHAMLQRHLAGERGSKHS